MQNRILPKDVLDRLSLGDYDFNNAETFDKNASLKSLASLLTAGALGAGAVSTGIHARPKYEKAKKYLKTRGKRILQGKNPNKARDLKKKPTGNKGLDALHRDLQQRKETLGY